MLKSDAKKLYKSDTELGVVLGISKQAVQKWETLVPFKRALQLEKISNGKLKLKKSLYTNGD